MGFWLQKEPLRAGAAFAWSKPRLLLELLPRVSWEYVLVVDADALPLQYSRSWEYLVKRHMRYRRYANDDTDRRHIFCPENCEAGSAKQYAERMLAVALCYRAAFFGLRRPEPTRS